MRTFATLLALATAFSALAAPFALGGWRALDARNNFDGSTNGILRAIGGSDEPNTAYDDAAHMFQAPNWATAEKVYLDVSLVDAATGPLNPNAGTPARIAPLVAAYPVALLGYWRDCNGDGYIGLAETGEREYLEISSNVLGKNVNLKICSGEPYRQQIGGGASDVPGTGVYLIDEFRAIGPGANDQGDAANAGTCALGTHQPFPGSFCAPMKRDKRDVADESARVWGDWRAPFEFPPLMRQGLFPLPPGALTSTNGLTKWVDDATTSHAVKNAYEGVFGTGSWSIRPCLGESDRSDLNGQDTDNGQSAPWSCNEIATDPTQTDNEKDSLYPLAVLRWRYNDSQHDEGDFGRPIVRVWDCQPGQVGPNPGPGGLTPALNPNLLGVDSGGSVAPTLAGLLEAPGDPASSYAGWCTWGASDHGPGQASGWIAYPAFGNLETEAQRPVFTHNAPDARFTFIPAYETAATGTSLNGGPDSVNVASACGLEAAACDRSSPGRGLWSGTAAYARRPPRHCFAVCERIYFTAYADVGVAMATGQLPSGNDAFTYGSDACGLSGIGTGQPIRNDWFCDPTLWDTSQLGAGGVLIGQRYDVRDVDCFDNEIVLGVKAGIAPSCV